MSLSSFSESFSYLVSLYEHSSDPELNGSITKARNLLQRTKDSPDDVLKALEEIKKCFSEDDFRIHKNFVFTVIRMADAEASKVRLVAHAVFNPSSESVAEDGLETREQTGVPAPEEKPSESAAEASKVRAVMREDFQSSSEPVAGDGLKKRGRDEDSDSEEEPRDVSAPKKKTQKEIEKTVSPVARVFNFFSTVWRKRPREDAPSAEEGSEEEVPRLGPPSTKVAKEVSPHPYQSFSTEKLDARGELLARYSEIQQIVKRVKKMGFLVPERFSKLIEVVNDTELEGRSIETIERQLSDIGALTAELQKIESVVVLFSEARRSAKNITSMGFRLPRAHLEFLAVDLTKRLEGSAAEVDQTLAALSSGIITLRAAEACLKDCHDARCMEKSISSFGSHAPQILAQSVKNMTVLLREEEELLYGGAGLDQVREKNAELKKRTCIVKKQCLDFLQRMNTTLPGEGLMENIKALNEHSPAAEIERVVREVRVCVSMTVRKLLFSQTHTIASSHDRLRPAEVTHLYRRFEQSSGKPRLQGEGGYFDAILARPSPSISRSELYHVLGDPMGAESRDLAGLDLLEAQEFLFRLLDSVVQEGKTEFDTLVKKQRDLLNAGMLMSSKLIKIGGLAAIDLREKIQELNLNESFILPGGWGGVPGHVIMYEIKKTSTSPESYRLYVYNTGKGAGYHEMEQRADRTMTSCLVIDDIDINRIDSDFVEMYRELFKTESSDVPFVNYMYRVLVPHLKGRQGGESRFVEMQSSGTCTVSSVYAFFETQMVPKDFSRLQIAMGLIAIKGFLEFTAHFLEKTGTEEREHDKNLAIVSKCIQYFSSMVLTKRSEGLISDQDFVALQRSIQGFEKTVAALCEKFHRKEACFVHTVAGPMARDLDRGDFIIPVERIRCRYEPIIEDTKSVLLLPAVLPPLLCNDVDSIRTAITVTIEWARKQREKGNGEEAHFELGRRIVELHVAICQHKDGLNRISREKREKVMADLVELGNEYVDCFVDISRMNGDPLQPCPQTIIPLLHLIDSIGVMSTDVLELIEAFDWRVYGDPGYQTKKEEIRTGFDMSPYFRGDAVFRPGEEYGDRGVAVFRPVERHSEMTELWLENRRFVEKNTFEKLLMDHGGSALFEKSSSLPVQIRTQLRKEVTDTSTGKIEPHRVGLALFSHNHRADFESAGVLPKGFFRYLDLVDLATFVCRCGGLNGRDVRKPWLQWRCRFSLSDPTCDCSVDDKDPSDRFPSIASPAPALTDWEQERYCTVYRFKKFQMDADLKIDTVISMVSSSPELFFDEKFRVFFESILFQPVVLMPTPSEEALEKYATLMHAFLSGQWALAVAAKNSETCLYILRLFRMWYEHIELVNQGAQREQRKKEILSFFDQVRPPMSNGSAYFQWHYERACLYDSDRKLSPEESSCLLESVLVARNLVKDQMPRLTYEVEKLVHEVFARSDVMALTKDDVGSIINRVWGISPPRVWIHSEETPYIYESKGHPDLQYRLTTGALIVAGGRIITCLPRSLEQSVLLKKTFLSPIESVLVDKNGCYSVRTIDGNSFKIIVKRSGIVIYKKIDGKWYQLSEGNPFESKEKRGLGVQPAEFQDKNMWIFGDKKGIRIRIESCEGRLLYEAEGMPDPTRQMKWTVFAGEGDRRRRLLPGGRLPYQFGGIENPSYVFPLSDDGRRVSRIVFPRLGTRGLTFDVDPATPCLRSVDFPEEIMVDDQYLSSLPRCRHVVVLQNRVTNKKRVLIPGHHLYPLEQGSALDTGSRWSEKDTEIDIPLYSYAVTRERLVPENEEGRVYLAYTYLWQQQYEDCQEVLEQIPNLPLSDQALRILGWIVEGSGVDFDAKSVALRLKAAAILNRQKLLFHKAIPPLNSKIKELFLSYASRQHYCGTVVVTDQEAGFLGIDGHARGIFIVRLPPVGFTWSLSADSLPDDFGSLGSEKATILKPQFEGTSFVRAYQCFRAKKMIDDWENVVDFFNKTFGIQLARPYSDAGWERAKTVLSIAARLPPSQVQGLAAILLALTMNPEIFPQSVDLEDGGGRLANVWKKTIVDCANSVLCLSAPLPVSSSPLRVEHLPLEQLSRRRLSDSQRKPSESIIDPGQRPVVDEAIGSFSSNPSPSSRGDDFLEEVVDCLRGVSAEAQLKEFRTEAEAFQPTAESSIVYTYKQENLRSEIEKINDDKQKEKESAKAARKEVISLLATTFDEEERALLQRGFVSAGYVRSVRLIDAVYALLEPFPEGFLRLNPALTPEKAQQLRDATIRYLIHKTRKQQLQRIVLTANELLSSARPSSEDIGALHTLMSAKRAYAPTEHPQYLVFESIFGNFLRSQQIESIDSFMSDEPGSASKVVEMIMGAGKTSVLMPIITHMVAQRGKLSVAVIPSQLFPSMGPQIAAALQTIYGTNVFSWQLEAGKAMTVQALRQIDLGLKDAFETHKVVLIRPEDIAGLFLEFLACIQGEKIEENPEKIRLLQSIFNQFHEHGEMLFDEVDSVWDVLKEQLLTTSGLQPLEPTVIETSAMLYTILLSDPEIIPQATAHDFKITSSPLLAQKFVDTMCHHSEFGSEIGTHQEVVRRFLRGECAKQDLPVLSEKLLDILCTAREQILHILPLTVTKICDVHYGQPSEGNSVAFPYAVPYETGTPVPSARFGHELEEVNCTIQMLLEGSGERLRPYVTSLVKTLQGELYREMRENLGGKVETTRAFGQLASLLGDEALAISALSLPEREGIEAIITYFSDNQKKRIVLVQRYILPLFQRPGSYFRVSAQIYSVLCYVLRGFSGTLWNKDTYPIPSIPSPEPIGKTVQILASERQEVQVIRPSTLDTLYTPDCGIIDVGGMLRGRPAREIAHKILEKSSPDIQGVIYYDEHKAQRVIDREGKDIAYAECRIPSKNLTAYWPQAFSRGADLRVAANSRCTVCSGKDTLFKDLLQGVWRLRKLGRGQHVQFALTEEVEGIIRSQLMIPKEIPITTVQVIAFVLKNQMERRFEDNSRSTRHKVEAVLQRGFVSMLLREGSPSVLQQALSACESLFVSTIPKRPSERYGNERHKVQASTWLEGMIQETMRSLACRYLEERGFLQHDSVEAELREISTQMGQLLPLEVSISPSTGEAHMQVQTQTQTETLVQQKVTIENREREDFFYDIESAVDWLVEKWTFCNKDEINRGLAAGASHSTFIMLMGEALGYDERTKDFASLFPANLGTSLSIPQVQVFAPHFTPLTRTREVINYAAVIEKADLSPLVIALSQGDATDLLESSNLQCRVSLMNIHTGEIYPLNYPKAEEQLRGNVDVQELRVLLKIFSGDIFLTGDELRALRSFCRKQPEGFKKMAAFIRSYVCVMYPHALAEQQRLLEMLLRE